MCKILITSVAHGDKIGSLSFHNVGADGSEGTIDYKAKFWPRAPWAQGLKVGDVGDAKFETIPGKPKKNAEGMVTGQWADEKFLHSWNGVECPALPGRGGGGAYSSKGKSETEILAALAIAAVRMDDPDKAFDDMIRLVNKGKGRLA